MKIDRVYELLEVLKEKDEDLNNKTKRVLKYIYQDVYLECFDKLMDIVIERVINEGAAVGSIRYDQAIEPYTESKKQLSVFLDGDESIVTYLLEMVKDGKKEFIDYFFNKTKTYFDIVDNHFYTNEDFSVYSFSFNIYCMLRAYHEHKDDFEVFTKIVDDSSFLINCGNSNDKYMSFFSKLRERKPLIDALVGNCAYGKVEKVSSMLKDVLSNIGRSYISYDVLEMIDELNLLDKIVLEYENISNDISSDKLISLNDVIERCVFKKYNRHYLPYYSSNLLIGERLSFVNEKLKVFFEVEGYRNDAFDKIKSMDYRLFEYLNSLDDQTGDSFIQCLNVLFDSDTYFEFNSKANSLIKASLCFKDGDIEESLLEVRGLDSLKHKKHIDNNVLSFSMDTNKPVNRELSIFRRMLALYDEYYKGSGLNTIPIMRKVFDNGDLVNLDYEIDVEIKGEIERLKALREAEERRQSEIKEELNEMRNALTNDTNDLDGEEKPASNPPVRKMRPFFGRRN